MFWYHVGHEEPRRTLSFFCGPGVSAYESGDGPAEGDVPKRGGPGVWGLPSVGQRLGAAAENRGRESAADGNARQTPDLGAEALSGCHDRAADQRSVPGPAEVAVCPLDAGGSAGVDPSALWGPPLDLDRGPLPSSLGLLPAETCPACL